MYQVRGTLGIGNVTKDGSKKQIYPYYSGVYFGLFNRGEIGINYGENISIAFKSLIFEEENFLPNLSVGVRSILSSPEAHFYDVDSLREDFEGEVFAGMSKNLFDITKINLGVSIISGLDSGGASPYFGIEQQIGGNFSLDLEVFKRQGSYHQSLGLTWRFKNEFRISAGLLELQEWFFQDGNVGFYASPAEERADLYKNPAIYVGLSLSGWMKEDETSTLNSQVSKIEERQKKQRAHLADNTIRLNYLETQLEGLIGAKAVVMKQQIKQINYLIKEIAGIFSSPAYDPVKIKALQDSIISFEDAAIQGLNNLVIQHTIDKSYQKVAIMTMGYHGSPAYVTGLKHSIESDNEDIRREAIFALQKLGTLEAKETILLLLDDPNSNIAETARQVAANMEIKKEPSEAEFPNMEDPDLNASELDADKIKTLGDDEVQERELQELLKKQREERAKEVQEELKRKE